MKRWITIFALFAFLTLLVFTAAYADSGTPVGSCPATFELHPYMDVHEPGHIHIGLTEDLNGDGWICMMMVGPGDLFHLHVDNYLPLE